MDNPPAADLARLIASPSLFSRSSGREFDEQPY